MKVIIVQGAHQLWGTTSVQQTIQVSKIIEHPQYDSLKLINDIALLKLESSIKMSDKVIAACLTTSRPSPGQNCYITGTTSPPPPSPLPWATPTPPLPWATPTLPPPVGNTEQSLLIGYSTNLPNVIRIIINTFLILNYKNNLNTNNNNKSNKNDNNNCYNSSSRYKFFSNTCKFI